MNTIFATAGVLLAAAGLITAFTAIPLRKVTLYCAAMALVGTGFTTEAAALHSSGLTFFGAAWIEMYVFAWLHFSGARLPGRLNGLLAAVVVPRPFRRKGRS